jgi:hypothetical protein
MPLIRSHPIMLITARNKMGAARVVRISLAGAPRETVSFPEDIGQIRQNAEVVRSLIRSLGNPARSTSNDGMHLWTGRPASEIRNLINSYVFGAEAAIVNRTVLGNYITECNGRGELVEWDITIPRGNPDRGLYTWAPNVSTRKVHRAPTSRHSIGVLRNPPDLEVYQRTLERPIQDPRRGCLMLYAVDRESTGKTGLRFFARPEDGEDIIGLMFIFPRPATAVNIGTNYVSQVRRDE